jgi:flagellar hook-basal body complex protein FliE
MTINGINTPNPLGQIGGAGSAGGKSPLGGIAPSGEDSFGSVIKNSLESLDGSQKAAEQEIAKAVTGESPDLHKTIIALQTADLKFQLGMQVRNKLIGAYEEVMRMQV